MLHFKVDITMLIVINIKNLFLLQMIIFLFCVWFKYPVKYPIICVILRAAINCKLNILKRIQIFIHNIFGCLCDYIRIVHESPTSKRTENNRFNFIAQSHIQNPPKPLLMDCQQILICNDAKLCTAVFVSLSADATSKVLFFDTVIRAFSL